jgi:hypothetical protein
VSDRSIDFGCDYCQDDQNRLYGHVPQIASDEQRRMLLLRCPRCGSLYENSARGPDRTRRLSEAEAERLFPAFGTVDAQSVRDVLNAVRSAPPAAFVSTVFEELDKRPAAAKLQASCFPMRRSDLSVIYSRRRDHLASHSVDVHGLDAFLAALQTEPEGTEICFIHVHTDTHNLILMTDQKVGRLLGWAAVPFEWD